MTESSQIPTRAPAELMELAKWVEDQLGATSISRQVIAEQAGERIRGLAEWLRGAAAPGDDPAAEEVRLPEAERVIMAALAADPAQMPPSVLLRAHQELLRQSRWLLGVVLGDPRLAETGHRVRAEGKRGPLEVATPGQPGARTSRPFYGDATVRNEILWQISSCERLDED